ncbi:hypothetical protein FRB99_002775, partial [Tulasnella sp. 403]
MSLIASCPLFSIELPILNSSVAHLLSRPFGTPKLLHCFTTLVWRLVFHALLILNFVRFCLVYLTVKAAQPPGPAAPGQTLEEGISNDKVDDILPKDLMARFLAIESSVIYHTDKCTDTQTLPTFQDHSRASILSASGYQSTQLHTSPPSIHDLDPQTLLPDELHGHPGGEERDFDTFRPSP